MLAIYEDLLAALRIFGRSMAPTYQLLRSRRKELEVREIAIQNWQVFNVFFVERNGNVGAVGFELLDLAADFNGLRHVTNGERSVVASGRIGGNLDILDFKYFEAACFDANVVHVRD